METLVLTNFGGINTESPEMELSTNPVESPSITNVIMEEGTIFCRAPQNIHHSFPEQKAIKTIYSSELGGNEIIDFVQISNFIKKRGGGFQQWWNENWLYYRNITLTNKRFIDYINFIFNLRFPGGFDYTNFKTNGEDIRFVQLVDGEWKILNYYINSWGKGIPVATLSAGIDAGTTTIPVQSTTGYPNSGVLLIENERIFYTSKTNTSFINCLRGYEETTAVSHIVNTNIYFETEIWIKVPELKSQSTIRIGMYYGNTNANAVSNKETTIFYLPFNSNQDLERLKRRGAQREEIVDGHFEIWKSSRAGYYICEFKEDVFRNVESYLFEVDIYTFSGVPSTFIGIGGNPYFYFEMDYNDPNRWILVRTRSTYEEWNYGWLLDHWYRMRVVQYKNLLILSLIDLANGSVIKYLKYSWNINNLYFQSQYNDRLMLDNWTFVNFLSDIQYELGLETSRQSGDTWINLVTTASLKPYQILTFLNNIIFINEEKNIVKWDGVSLNEIGGGKRAKYGLVHKNRLWLFNFPGLNEKSMFWYSNINRIDAVGDWQTGGVNNVEYVSKDDGYEITGAAIMGDSILIFKENAVYLLYGDVPNLWLKKLNIEVGCVAWRSIANWKDGVFFLSNQGIHFIHGTVAETPVIFTVDNIQSDNLAQKIRRIFNNAVAISSAVGIVWDGRYYVAISSYNSPENDVLLVLDYQRGIWSYWIPPEPITAMYVEPLLNIFYIGTTTGKLRIQSKRNWRLEAEELLEDNKKLSSYYETGHLDLGLPNVRKRLRYVDVAYTGALKFMVETDNRQRSYDLLHQDNVLKVQRIPLLEKGKFFKLKMQDFNKRIHSITLYFDYLRN